MIVARVRGGLGNQLFQYAVAWSLSRRHRCEFRLHVPIVRLHTDRQYALQCFRAQIPVATLRDFRAFKGGIFSWPFLRRRLHPQVRMEKGHNFEPGLLKARPPLYLEGYWQSEKYFAEYRRDLLRELAFKSEPTARNAELLRKIRGCESVAVHIRRGDYAASPAVLAHHGVLDRAYYATALDTIVQRTTDPTFFVFSDDPQWAREILGAKPHHLITNTGAAFEDLRLMSACKHQVIANSTFSWWSAWLNQYPGKLVVAPRQWLRKHPSLFEDVYPAGWLRL